MTKKIVFSVLLLSTLIFAGCFDIREEIFLEKNGSGKYITTIDMTKLKDMVEMFKTMMPDSSGEGNDQLNNLNSLDSLQQLWKDIDNVPGITDVKRTKKEEMVF